MYKLTETGKKKAEGYIRELQAKRKEILDAGKDKADETIIPDVEDIEADLGWWVGEDPEDPGLYYNNWGCTDNNEGDVCLELHEGEDFITVDKRKEVT